MFSLFKFTLDVKQISVVVLDIATGAGDSIPEPVKSATVSPIARHRCDVSSELCCPGAKPRRWIPPLVTRFGVIPRV